MWIMVAYPCLLSTNKEKQCFSLWIWQHTCIVITSIFTETLRYVHCAELRGTGLFSCPLPVVTSQNINSGGDKRSYFPTYNLLSYSCPNLMVHFETRPQPWIGSWLYIYNTMTCILFFMLFCYSPLGFMFPSQWIIQENIRTSGNSITGIYQFQLFILWWLCFLFISFPITMI